MSLIGFAMFLYMLLALLFVSTLHAQSNDDEYYDVFGSNDLREFVHSDLLKILVAGGIDRIDTSLLGGRVLNDTTLAYDRNGENFIVNFNLQYIKDGAITDEWSVRVDSALLGFHAYGTVAVNGITQQITMQADPRLITGIKPTSTELVVYPCIKPPSTMRIITLKLKFWMYMERFLRINEQMDFGALTIQKSNQDITGGSGIITLTRLDAQGNPVSEKVLNVEFVGDHQALVTENGETRTVTYNTLGFLFP